MRKNEFYHILAILTLGLASIISPIVLAYLPPNTTINSRGKILTIKTPITYKSEIRGVFIHEAIYSGSRNWIEIAETLANYDIDAVFVNDQGGTSRRSDSEISQAIAAFHSYGIEYHSSVLTLGETATSGNLSSLRMIRDSGDEYSSYWICPIKAHDTVINNLADYLNDHPDVDGIMLDYIRYPEACTCYCDSCKAAFEEWLGEGEITDWTPFYPGGSRWSEYAEWRNMPVTTLVKDVHDLVKDFDSSILISEAAWVLWVDTAIYWRKWIGQDTAKWIAEGYIDFVVPMTYTKNIDSGAYDDRLDSFINATRKYWIAGQPEGEIPLLAFLRTDWPTSDLTPEQFAAQVNYVRSRGVDGWIIFRYSGAGGYLSGAEYDTADYLDALDLPATFGIYNINVETTANSATVTWSTDLPATSKIEYSTNSLFNASWETQSGFHYWKITRIQPTVVADSFTVTEHSLTLTELMPGTVYYFRVQSQGASGIATSKVMIFTTSA